jgi:glycosyltransferase involved in cell wall biosynthesis
MRVAILADSLTNQRAGVHHYTKGLINSLEQLDSEIDYIIITERKQKCIKNCKQVVIRNYNFIGYRALRMFFIIPWIIRKLKVDLVVEPAHFGPFNLPKKVKRITIIHDLTPILFPYFHPFRSQLLQRLFLNKILRKADYIVTNSKYTMDDIVKKYSFTKEKVSFIYLGYDRIFKPQENNKEVLSNYGIVNDFFLFVGTIEPRKNLKTLIRAFSLLKEETKKDIKLVIIGEIGWKSNELLKQINLHPLKDEIFILGYVPSKHLPAFYNEAQVNIMPSFYEGFGMTVLESFACGTPSIVSSISSLPEVGGDASLTFDPNDVLDLKQKMRLITEDEELLLGLRLKSLERAKCFSWGDYAHDFDKIVVKTVQ